MALTDSNGLVLATQSIFGGSLAAGRYRIKAQWDKSNLGVDFADGGFGTFVEFLATPIPEPGTAALLALGLGALAARRRGRGSAR